MSLFKLAKWDEDATSIETCNDLFRGSAGKRKKNRKIKKVTVGTKPELKVKKRLKQKTVPDKIVDEAVQKLVNKKAKNRSKKRKQEEINDSTPTFTKPKNKNKDDPQINRTKLIKRKSNASKIENVNLLPLTPEKIKETKKIKKKDKLKPKNKNKLTNSKTDLLLKDDPQINRTQLLKRKSNASKIETIDLLPLTPEKIKETKKIKKKEKLKNKLKAILMEKKPEPDLSINQKKSIKKLTLRERMLEKLKAARFRYLNEHIYMNNSTEAQALFSGDSEAFGAYHEGYRQQVNRWPLNPLDVVIESIKKMSKQFEIADFGCGDATLAKSVKQKVHSFDLVAANESVIACDMAHVPLQSKSVDVVVFCLSLMGTNLHEYLLEANRVLKLGGIIKVVEVESRFENVDVFIEGVQRFGFKKFYKDFSHNLFYFLDFKKVNDVKKKNKLPTLSLHPCLYKKR